MIQIFQVIAAFIPVVVLLRQRKIVRAFRAAGATSPEASMPLSNLGLRNSILLGRFRRRGIVCEPERDRLYLDEAQLSRWHVRRRKILRVVLFLTISTVLALWWLDR